MPEAISSLRVKSAIRSRYDGTEHDLAFRDRRDARACDAPARRDYADGVQFSRAIATVTPWKTCLAVLIASSFRKQRRGSGPPAIDLFLDKRRARKGPQRLANFVGGDQPQRRSQQGGGLGSPGSPP